MPRPIPFLAALVLVVALTACGGDNGDESRSTPSQTTTSGAGEPPATTPTATTSNSPAPGAGISQDEAEQIALAAAGPGSAVLEAHQGDEHGRPVYEFQISVGGQTRDIEVDRETGEVVRNEPHD